MVIVLYAMNASSPCRSVALFLKHANLPCELKHVDLLTKQQLQPEFLKMNLQHTVPTIDDEGFYLHESRAILQYLANQYCSDNATLYPKDAKKRAIVDRMLMFDLGTLYDRFGQYVYPVLFASATPCPEKRAKVEEALGWLDQYIGENNWVAGAHLTIADFACAASVATMQHCGFDLSQWKNVSRWLAGCKKELRGYESENEEGARAFGQWYDSVKNRS